MNTTENSAVKTLPRVFPEAEVSGLAENIGTIEKIHVESISGLSKKNVYSFVKRIMDIVLSFMGIIVLAVPMFIIAIWIKLDSRGPIIYKQERLGKNRKKFILYKFRSMETDAEKNGARWASYNDSRITGAGTFLRKYRLDELPQMYNIFFGQMSIVGPRPEREYFYLEFSTYIEGFDQRMAVPQGLTGWAQVNGGYDLKPEEKIVYDIEYIKNRSLIFDIKCILATIKIFFSHSGAR